MHTTVRRILSAARTCKKALWSCARSVRKVVLRCSRLKRHKKMARGGDEAVTVTSLAEEKVDDSPKAIENQTNSTATTVTVEMVHREVTTESTVDCEEKPKNGKKAKRTRRKKGRKSGADTPLPVELMAEEKTEKAEDGISRNTEIPAESMSLIQPPTFASSSATNNEAEPCKGQKGEKANSALQKKGKSKVDSPLPKEKISQKTRDVLDAAESTTKTPADSSTLVMSSVTKNGEKTPKSRVTVVGAKQPRDAAKVSPDFGRIDEKPRRQPRVVSDDVPRAKEQRCASKENVDTSFSWRVQRTKPDGNCKEKPADASKVSGNTVIAKSSGISRCSTLGQPAIVKRNTAGEENTATAAIWPKAIPDKLQSNNEIQRNRAENACAPRMAVRKTAAVDLRAGAAKNRLEYTTEELNKKAMSILNKIAPRNAAKLTENFKALPIDTVERLENITTLVFEKAVGEQCYARLYATLCSSMKSVQVTCPESKRTVTFSASILRKCQDVFEEHKVSFTEAAAKELAKINSCRNPEEQVRLQLEYEEKERRIRKRAVGNCRFIGELFKQRMVTASILLYCIANLVDRRSEQPLESLCNLLIVAGEELERCCDLNGTFIKLKVLTSDKSVSTRIRFMIESVIELRMKNSWSRVVEKWRV